MLSWRQHNAATQTRRSARLTTRVFHAICRSRCRRLAPERAQVTVRWPGGVSNVELDVVTSDATKGMNRSATEPVQQCLARLASSLQKGKGNKQKRRKQHGKQHSPPASALTITLYADADCTAPIDPQTATGEAWATAAMLEVQSSRCAVRYNPPTVAALALHGAPLVGHTVLPRADVQFCEEAECSWEWRRLRGAGATGSAQARAAQDGAEGEVVSTERLYVPAAEDEGARLRVACTPQRGAGEAAVLGETAVALSDVVAAAPAAPLSCLATPTPPPAPPALRVLTYNLLADQYASQDFSRAVLFAHTPPEYLDIAFRQQRIGRQLLNSGADVMCLQECDRKVFERFLEPLLATAGYRGVFSNKAGGVHEGSATFYRASRFVLAASKTIDLRALFTPPLAPSAAPFQPLLDASPGLAHSLTRVTTIAQALLLLPHPDAAAPAGGPIILANTHLFFHGRAPHIRNMHVAALLTEAAALARAALPRGAAAAVFCGDLNSDLNDGVPGVVRMLQDGRLAADYWDWACGADFDFRETRDVGARAQKVQNAKRAPERGISLDAYLVELGQGGEEGDASSSEDEEREPNSKGIAITGVDVALPFAFTSSHDPETQSVTNYVPKFSGVLDYIWCETGRVRVARAAPVPPPAELGGYLPNAQNPSDHLPVVADIEVAPAAREHAAAVAAAARAAAVAATAPNPRSGSLGEQLRQSAMSQAMQDAAAAERGARREDVAASVLRGAGEAAAAEAAAMIQQGRIVALPTDTLYGLAGLCSDAAAIEAIYAIKGRDRHVPLALCVAEAGEVRAYGDCGHLPDGLLEALLPGPVTVVLQRAPGGAVAEALNPGRATVAVRVPDCAFVRSVCRRVGAALVLTSANASGEPSSVEVRQFEGLWGRLAGVFDGGRIDGDPLGSTIVDLSRVEGYRVLRDGSALQATAAVLARFGVPAATEAAV